MQQQAQEAMNRLREHLETVTNIRRLTVLLIEDNDDDAALLIRSLPCVDVTVCKDLQSAVDKTIHESFDVVLLDLYLSPGSGHEWIEATKDYRDKNTSIIAITGLHEDHAAAKEVLTMGCDAVLLKGEETYSMLRALFSCKTKAKK